MKPDTAFYVLVTSTACQYSVDHVHLKVFKLGEIEVEQYPNPNPDSSAFSIDVHPSSMFDIINIVHVRVHVYGSF